MVNFRVEGLEQNCERCAWSIVEGDTCHDADKLGNTLYYDHTDPALVTFNPYSMCYYSTKDGRSESSETVLNGYNMEENEGRAIVLSDGNGAPLACGILKEKNLTSILRVIDTALDSHGLLLPLVRQP